MEDNNIDIVVDGIMEQLKSHKEGGAAPLASKPAVAEYELTNEELENFIIINSGKLVTKTLDVVDNVKDYISSSPDSRDVTSFAELLKAAAASMDTLNKIYIAREKNKNNVKIKEMDIAAKIQINTQDNVTAVMLSRKELIAELIGKSEASPSKESPTSSDNVTIDIS